MAKKVSPEKRSRHAPTQAPGVLPFAARERMAHIERCLFWKGELQRADLTGYFGINPAQAAADFREYMSRAPGNMSYDATRKRYLPTADFKPRFIEPASVDEFVGLESSLVPVSTWPIPPRTASPETLQAVVGAIRRKEAIEIRYQSMTDPNSVWRWITPHAFASDGDRWHVRAYCHKHDDFRDFVLGRIERIRKAKPSSVDSGCDHDWNTIVQIEVAPNPKLSADQQKAIASEYGIRTGKTLKLKIRRSMLFYLEAQYSKNSAESAIAAHQLIVHSSQ